MIVPNPSLGLSVPAFSAPTHHPLLLLEPFVWNGEGSGALQSLLPSLGSNCNDLIWSLDRPGGWTEGIADGCPSLSGGWHAASVVTVGPPCRSPFRAGVSARGQSQGDRRQAAWAFARGRDRGGQGCVGRTRARQSLLYLPAMVAVSQMESSASFSSALSFFLGLPACRQVQSLEPAFPSMSQGSILGNAVWGLIGQDLRPTDSSEASMGISFAESQN